MSAVRLGLEFKLATTTVAAPAPIHGGMTAALAKEANARAVAETVPPINALSTLNHPVRITPAAAGYLHGGLNE